MLSTHAPSLARFTRRDAVAPGIAALILIVVPDGDPRRRHPARRAPPGERRRALARRHHRAARHRLRQRRPDRPRRGPLPVRASSRNTTSRARTRSRSPRSSSSRFEHACRTDRHDLRRGPHARGTCVAARDGRAEPVRRSPAKRSSVSMPRAGRPSGPSRRGSSTRRCARNCATPQVAEARTSLSGRMAGGLDESERMLAAELISPLMRARTRRSARSSPPRIGTGRRRPWTTCAVQILQGEVIVRQGTRLEPPRSRRSTSSGSASEVPDFASFAGWLLLAVLVVVMLLGWIWRFRPQLWHRNNVADPDRAPDRRAPPSRSR